MAEPEPDGSPVAPATGRRIAALAFPALGVLAAEPIYLLFDIAVVGRLGALPLAGLAIGGLILSTLSSQMTFLSYGTTARSARFFGAGNRTSAVGEGVQATWLALGLGTLIIVVVEAAAVPLVSALAAGGDIAATALPWVRIAIVGVPAILVSAAGNGWMRGVQDTGRPLRYVVAGFAVSAVLCPLLVYGWLGMPRLELAGSAVANLVGQWVAALLFLRSLLAERVPLRVQPEVLRAQVVMGRDLVLRTMAFQACFVSAGAVAARFGAAAVAAHQVVLQLWNFLALVLDSLAIAAQSLVGAALGAGQLAHAKSVAWRVTIFSTLASARAGRGLCRRSFGVSKRIHRRPLGARRHRGAVVVHGGPITGRRNRFRAGRGAARRWGREVHAQRHPDQRVGRVPAVDLAFAGVRLGSTRHLVRLEHIHGAAAGVRRLACVLRSLAGAWHRLALIERGRSQPSRIRWSSPERR